MNYLKEINAFRNCLKTNSIPAIAQALWYTIIDYHNSSNWERWVIIDNLKLMAELGVTKSTLEKHRNILIQFGLLEYKSVPRKKNSSKYKLLSFELKETGIKTGLKNSPVSNSDCIPDKTGINFNPDCSPDRIPDCSPDCGPECNPDESGKLHCEGDTEDPKLNKTKLNKIVVVNNDNKEIWLEVIDYYCKKANKSDTNLKIQEREAIQALCKYIPLEIVIKGINNAFENYKPKFDGDKINSFLYCVPVIKNVWELEKAEKPEGVLEDGTVEQSDGIKTDESGIGFHL